MRCILETHDYARIPFGAMVNVTRTFDNYYDMVEVVYHSKEHGPLYAMVSPQELIPCNMRNIFLYFLKRKFHAFLKKFRK